MQVFPNWPIKPCFLAVLANQGGLNADGRKKALLCVRSSSVQKVQLATNRANLRDLNIGPGMPNIG